MPYKEITGRYFQWRLAGIVAAMVVSVVVGIATARVGQEAFIARNNVIGVIDRLYQETVLYSLNLREIQSPTDSQRGSSFRANLRRSAETLRGIASEIATLEFDADTNRKLAISGYDPATAIALLLRVADHLKEPDSPYGAAAARPVAVGLETVRQTIPQINAVRDSEQRALQALIDRFAAFNTASLFLSLLLVIVAIFLIFRPMQRHVLQAQKALIAERILAENASMAKTQFLAVMSHEIRTPLNGVLGMADVLLASDIDPRHRELVEVISQSGTALMEIINDVLDLAKIEAGKIEIALEAFDLTKCLENITALFRGVAERKGISLQLRRSADPVMIIGDERALRQIATNLVNNAIKFTDRGAVTIDLSTHPVADNRLKVEIAVQDSGIGIAKEAQSRIFDNFVQAEASTTRKFGGTGLGLSISRQLIEVLGGTLQIDSFVDQGATFTISLEVERAALEPSETAIVKSSEGVSGPKPETEHENAPEFENPNPVANYRILVVDDSSVNLKVMTSLLKRLGITPQVLNSGAEAVATFASGALDIVFMDISMPEIDGYETTRQIREIERAEHLAPVRIIGLSAHAGEAERARALAAGMDDYLTKPIRYDTLRTTLFDQNLSLSA